MGTIASNKGGADFELIPEGSYLAVCDQVVDLGIQPGGQYDPQHKIYLRFQVPSERVSWKDKDGHEHEGPMVIGRTFTLSLGEKSHLRPFLESWRGRAFTKEELDGFDVKNVLGAGCMIQVIHAELKDGKKFAKVSTAMSLPRGTSKPALEGELLYLDADAPDQRVLEKLSKYVREKFQGRLTAEQAITQMANTPPPASRAPVQPASDPFDDDIPF